MSRTALDLDVNEWGVYDPTGNTALPDPSQQKLLARRQRQAWRVARQAAKILKCDFQAERVMVFGSLVHKSGFTPYSDIDLVAWGIPPERFYEAVAVVTGLSGDFKVDLLDTDTCSLALREAIAAEAKEL